MPTPTARRPILAVIGNSGRPPAEVLDAARELGRLAVDAGFRILTGGMDGVMAAVSQGARESEAWTEGTVVGVLPTADADAANPWVDIAIATGMGYARNAIVAGSADVVVAVRGSSGTLSEAAFAWQAGKPIVALASTGGWAARIAGQHLDDRWPDPVREAHTPEEAVEIARGLATWPESP